MWRKELEKEGGHTNKIQFGLTFNDSIWKLLSLANLETAFQLVQAWMLIFYKCVLTFLLWNWKFAAYLASVDIWNPQLCFISSTFFLQDGPHTVYHRRPVSSDGISATSGRREKEEPWLSRCYPSSRQGSAQRFRANTDTAAVRLQASRARKRHLDACWRGAGVQPGGAAHHWAQVPKAGLVQNPAPQTNYPRRRMQQSYHYQQVLLWPVQFLLHPQACP